jgi:hypothetical protein
MELPLTKVSAIHQVLNLNVSKESVEICLYIYLHICFIAGKACVVWYINTSIQA